MEGLGHKTECGVIKINQKLSKYMRIHVNRGDFPQRRQQRVHSLAAFNPYTALIKTQKKEKKQER